MIRAWLDRRFVKRARKAMTLACPGRSLSLIGHEQRRERVKTVARQIRAELGLPEVECLK